MYLTNNLTLPVCFANIVATMYIDRSTVKTSSGKSHTRVLLRESYREKGKVKKRTLANLTALPEQLINVIKSYLTGKPKSSEIEMVNLREVVANTGLRFGSLFVLFTFIKRMGILDALGNSRNALLIAWLICARILFQGSRLKAARLAKQYAVKSVLGVEEFNEDQLYKALDWLHGRQKEIEKYLLRHNKNNTKGLFLYDVTSCYFEGEQNELSDYGYNRDGKKGKKQIVLGLLTDVNGDPLSIEVFPGNTTDPKTCSDRIEEIKNKYGAESITLVGDRGMIKGPQIKEILAEGWNYITAITKPQIEKMLKEGPLQMSLFDEEIHEVIDGSTRYVLRRNPQRVREINNNRLQKEEKLLIKAEERTKYLKEHPRASEKAALKHVNQWASKMKLGKWIEVYIENRIVTIKIDQDKRKEAARLDGCYVIKTNIMDSDRMTAQQVHDRYKDLAMVEWAFRSVKTTLLENRPIYHRLEKRTRAVCFISMLAYKVARNIIGELSGSTGKLLKLMFRKLADADNQVLPLDDILRELDMIQETTLETKKVKVPVILSPSPVGGKILSILKVRLPVPKMPQGSVH